MDLVPNNNNQVNPIVRHVGEGIIAVALGGGLENAAQNAWQVGQHIGRGIRQVGRQIGEQFRERSRSPLRNNPYEDMEEDDEQQQVEGTEKDHGASSTMGGGIKGFTKNPHMWGLQSYNPMNQEIVFEVHGMTSTIPLSLKGNDTHLLFPQLLDTYFNMESFNHNTHTLDS